MQGRRHHPQALRDWFLAGEKHKNQYRRLNADLKRQLNISRSVPQMAPPLDTAPLSKRLLSGLRHVNRGIAECKILLGGPLPPISELRAALLGTETRLVKARSQFGSEYDSLVDLEKALTSEIASHNTAIEALKAVRCI
ncbi:hypothetical protein KIPB_006817 [Kipferlia bialata]|uniref:Uncharacterized protein n=1 Tax=Kipferlia bialata TaxID=797122 RepID=A0A391NMK2_9EUKA|nr:hypothetical protein KIPB_006817 [Kipferlia bialata]|eukprot:g6817.t1